MGNQLALPQNAIVGTMPVIINENPVHWKYLYRIPLETGREYRFDGWNVGSFPITGGACGNFTVELNRQYRVATIFYGDSIVFTTDRIGDRITVQDNPVAEGGSSVILTMYGSRAKGSPIPIQTGTDKDISLTGDSNFIITGNGALLKHAGKGIVTVNADLGNLNQEGVGKVLVHGKVEGNVEVSDIGSGTITIDGDVEGDIIQNGGGYIEVKGHLKGNIEQSGTGKIQVHKKLHGTVLKWSGLGYIQVDDEDEAEEMEEVVKETGSGDA